MHVLGSHCVTHPGQLDPFTTTAMNSAADQRSPELPQQWGTVPLIQPVSCTKVSVSLCARLLQVRLLMCYCATHPEKMDATKQMQWQKLAKLTDMDMNTITNLEFLGVPVRKRGKATSSLTFGRKRKRAVRKVSCLTLPSVKAHAVLLGCGSRPLSGISSWWPHLEPQVQAGGSQGALPDGAFCRGSFLAAELRLQAGEDL